MGCRNLIEAAMLEIGWNHTLTEHGRFCIHLLLTLALLPLSPMQFFAYTVRLIFSGLWIMHNTHRLFTDQCSKCEPCKYMHRQFFSSPYFTFHSSTALQTNGKVIDFAQTDCNFQYNHTKVQSGSSETYWGVEAMAVRRQWNEIWEASACEGVFMCTTSLPLQITCQGILCLTSSIGTLQVHLICSGWCNRVKWSTRKEIIHFKCSSWSWE